MAKHASLLRHDELWTYASKLQVIVDNSPHCSGSKPLIKDALNEISGPRSSGKTSLCLYVLAQATARGEVCAVIDMHHSFHPASARAAGVALEQLVWVRCQRDVQNTIQAADLLLHAGGFGVVLLDLCEASPRALQRIPLSYWHRLRRAVEHTPAILLICSNSSEARCSFVNKLAIKRKAEHWTGERPFLQFQGLEAAATSSKALTAAPERFYLSPVYLSPVA